jgi:hypothetical protein
VTALEIKRMARDLAENFIALLELSEEIGQQFTALRTEIERMDTLEEARSVPTVQASDRIRGTAFRRVPREEADAVVLHMMKHRDGDGWVSAAELAAERAGDDLAAFRYFKGSWSRSLREGYEEGIYDHRRQSGVAKVGNHSSGFMDQYRIVSEES